MYPNDRAALSCGWNAALPLNTTQYTCGKKKDSSTWYKVPGIPFPCPSLAELFQDAQHTEIQVRVCSSVTPKSVGAAWGHGLWFSHLSYPSLAQCLTQSSYSINIWMNENSNFYTPRKSHRTGFAPLIRISLATLKKKKRSLISSEF